MLLFAIVHTSHFMATRVMFGGTVAARLVSISAFQQEGRGFDSLTMRSFQNGVSPYIWMGLLQGLRYPQSANSMYTR